MGLIPVAPATWLRFHAADVVAEFLDTYPQHRLDGRIAKLEADREPLAAKVSSVVISTWVGSAMSVRERTWRGATSRVLRLCGVSGHK